MNSFFKTLLAFMLVSLTANSFADPYIIIGKIVNLTPQAIFIQPSNEFIKNLSATAPAPSYALQAHGGQDSTTFVLNFDQKSISQKQAARTYYPIYFLARDQEQAGPTTNSSIFQFAVNSQNTDCWYAAPAVMQGKGFPHSYISNVSESSDGSTCNFTFNITN